MILVPFKGATPEMVDIFSNPENASFTRCVGRYLTLDEVNNLPQVLQDEVLVVSDQDIDGRPYGCRGLVVISEFPNKVFKWSMVLIEKRQGCNEPMRLLEEYCTNVREARIIMTETLGHQPYLGEHLLKTGYSKGGEIPGLAFINGKYESVSTFYKNVVR